MKKIFATGELASPGAMFSNQKRALLSILPSVAGCRRFAAATGDRQKEVVERLYWFPNIASGGASPPVAAYLQT